MGSTTSDPKAGGRRQARGSAKGGSKAATSNPSAKGAKGAKGGSKPPAGSGSRGRARREPASGKGAKATGGKGAASASSDDTGGSGGRAGRMFRPFREHLGDRRRDAGGLALLVLGVVAGLGTYADAAGPVGAFLEALTLGLLGLVGFLIPVLLAWFGLLVVIGRPGGEIGRIAVGSVVLAIGLLGGLHLLAGAPDPAAGMRGLWLAGGLLGWVVATPLVWALSVWGATPVLVAISVLGLLVITKTPVSAVIDAVRGMVTRSDDEPDPDTEPEQAGTTASTASLRGSAEEHDPTEEVGAARIRATLEGKRGEQLPIRGVDDDEEAQPASAATGTPQEASAGTPQQPSAGDAPGADDELAATRPTERAKVADDPATTKARPVAPEVDWGDYDLPDLELLSAGRSMEARSARTIDAQTAALQETFDQFGVNASVARWSRGPTVTRFEIELGPGVQVKKVANMGDDIAYALAAPDVRIVAPIPGKSAIGIEVPNRERDLITLGDILRSDAARSDPHPLTVAIGVDIAGTPELINLASMPHLLVSGATGSGKSVTLNGMISSVIMRARPDQVRMILVDPKRVELNHYQGAPHLLSPVVTDPRRAADAVQWCVKEMEQRYDLLAQLGYRNIDGYNEAVAAGLVEPRPGPEGEVIEPKPMPYVLLVIDELADLMLVAPRDVEDAICRIAQMARAVGIHMIIATQRPSVDVITGLIKANIPSRLALQVASQTDSRTILDMNGAEKLVGKGDLLFLPATQGKPSRLQGCWVTESEISGIVEHCRAQREPEFEEEVVKQGSEAEQTDAIRSGDADSDEAMLRRAAEQVVSSGLGSTSMLQRKLRVGFARAGRLMDELEELGVVGPNEGSKARDVLWSQEQLDDANARGTL